MNYIRNENLTLQQTVEILGNIPTKHISELRFEYLEKGGFRVDFIAETLDGAKWYDFVYADNKLAKEIRYAVLDTLQEQGVTIHS